VDIFSAYVVDFRGLNFMKSVRIFDFNQLQLGAVMDGRSHEHTMNSIQSSSFIHSKTTTPFGEGYTWN